VGLFGNKKGIDYAVLLVVVVFISVGALYGQVSKQPGSLEKLGEAQTPILQANVEARLLETYMRESAKLSIEETKQKIRHSGPDSCIVSNTRAQPEVVSSILPLVEQKFTESFDVYLSRYESEKSKRSPGWQIPRNALSLAVSDSNVIGIYEKPIRIPLIDVVGKDAGSVVLRPAFEVRSDAFKSLSAGFKEVESIASSCSQSSNISDCISSKASLRVESEGELYRFISPNDEFCLSLHFPVIV